MRFIASVSFGKDSLAMLLKLLELNYPLDEVVYFDIGAEFDCIKANADKMAEILNKRGVEFTILKPRVYDGKTSNKAEWNFAMRLQMVRGLYEMGNDAKIRRYQRQLQKVWIRDDSRICRRRL